MRRIIALAGLLMLLLMIGCTPAKKTVSEKTLLKCTTCGVEFTVDEGMQSYEAAHPK